ncbi:MAG: hypothetical protein HSCHL_2461 [Hydrogenibacillus schlegelii]|uniref:Uncharacterized protein n=1 Tax=Hydrogenibacillus schlegelii TaxID=1484 RepID=A0A2T5G9V0_HYDSH|nr:MAG: hypothetical protein HSCHL_2461 [Hydrogenibacillus schlegelii]
MAVGDGIAVGQRDSPLRFADAGDGFLKRTRVFGRRPLGGRWPGRAGRIDISYESAAGIRGGETEGPPGGNAGFNGCLRSEKGVVLNGSSFKKVRRCTPSGGAWVFVHTSERAGAYGGGGPGRGGLASGVGPVAPPDDKSRAPAVKASLRRASRRTLSPV